MTVINPKSISGITSITLPSGGDNVLTIHTNDGVERFRIDSSGNVKVGSAATISPDGDVFFTGVCTATTLAGAASGLTGALPAISAASLTNVPAANVVGVHTSLTVTNATTTGTAVVGGGVTISESGIEASGIGITCANINGGQIGGRRNVLFNGAMQVVQRGTSFTNVGASANTFTLDRWKIYVQNSTARFTVTQDSDSPDEFGGSMKIDCTTTDTSLASTDEVYLEQRIEGQDLQHFAKGTSSAKQYTLSFYAKTTKTGTYIVNLLSRDNTTGSVSAAYTVSDTNWNRYVIPSPADTDSNRKDNNDNGEALRILWWFVAGSAVNSGTLNTSWGNSSDTGRATGQVNFSDSTSNDFYLTGCQLEVGPQASAYEHRSFAEELALCKRYYQEYTSISNRIYTQNVYRVHHPLPVEMRGAPTVTKSYGTSTNLATDNTSASTKMLKWDIQYTGAGTGIIDIINGTITLDAEL